MYQLKHTLANVGLYFLDESLLITGSTDMRSLELNFFNFRFENLQTVITPFFGGIDIGDRLYFTDHINNRLGSISKKNLSISYTPDFTLLGLNEDSTCKDLMLFAGYVQEVGFALFDLKSMQVKKVYDPSRPQKRLKLHHSGFLTFGGSEESIVSNCNYNNETVWSVDLKDVGKYKDIFGQMQLGTVSSLQIIEHRVLVVSGRSVSCFDLHDGHLLWQKLDKPLYQKMERGKDWLCLYAQTGYRLINLHIGEWLGEMQPLRNIGYAHIEGGISPSGYGFVYHEGLLWHDISNRGFSYIAAIEPLTGEYVWLHHLKGITRQSQAPVFHGSRMFLLSDSHELLVFEKEKFA